MPIEVAIAALAMLAFYGYCLFDLARSDPQSVRVFPKSMWLALLVLTVIMGGLLWITAGRPRRPVAQARLANNQMNSGGPVG